MKNIMKTALRMDIHIIKWMLLLLSLALIPDSARASRPIPVDTTRAYKAEAVYSDSAFVGFKVKYINTMEEMTETYNSFYDKYILPYIEYALAENDTVFVIDEKFQEDVYITIHSSRKNLYISPQDWSDEIEEVPTIPEEYIAGTHEYVAWLPHYNFYTTIFKWNAVDFINLFCNSISGTRLDLDGNVVTDKRFFTFYRIVKKGDAITEYASLSCENDVGWHVRHILFNKEKRPWAKTISL